MYKGTADWEPIAALKKNSRIRIPVIGNGDICSPLQAKKAFEDYGVDGVMIGRAAIGRPWIFGDIKEYMTTGEIRPDLSLERQIEVIKSQITDAVDWLDERRGILHMRRHMAGMFKGLSHFRDLRIEMLRASTKEELWETFDRIRERYSR